MKVTQEKLPDSQLGLEIEIPGELSKQVYDQTLSKLSREVSLPGFRKGKVPRHILVQRLGEGRIKASAIEDLIQKGIDQAIEKEEIEALGNYKLKSGFEELIGAFEPGQPLTFSASVDVPPSPVMKGYKGITVQAEEIKYDTEKVGTVLADYQKQLATLVPVEDRAAKEDDVAIIDFKGHLDLPEDAEEGTEPEEIPGGSAEDFQVELGENKFIPGFIEGMMGMKPDETRKVPATFPEDYPQPEVAGKKATFEITLKELKTRELPKLDDDFAQEVSDFETLKELRESLEKRYQEEADEKTKNNKHEAISKALAELIEVELPETMVQRESNQLLTQTLMRLSDQGMDINKIFTKELAEQFREQSKPEAIERLKLTLSLGEIAKAESISVDDAAVDDKIKEVLENTTQDKSEIDMDRLKSVVKEDLLKDEIMDWVESNGTVELVPEGSLAQEEAEEAEATEATEATTAEKKPEDENPEKAKKAEAEPAEEKADEAKPAKVKKAKAEKKQDKGSDSPKKKSTQKKPKKS